jgi:hypothetical protein
MNRFNALKPLFALALAAIAVLALPSLAAAKHRDRNHDRIPDRWEKRHHLSLKVNQAGRDQDRDRLKNRAEFMAGDNPRKADSDGDGIPDGEENAGRILSFDPTTGKLAIGLFGGDTVSGLVTGATEIECHGGTGASTSDAGLGDGESGEDGPGDQGPEAGDDDSDSGESGDDDSGENEVGDDSSEEEPGDDHGGEAAPGSDPAGGEHGNCTTAAFVEGTVVREAELKLTGGSAVFEKVELAG